MGVSGGRGRTRADGGTTAILIGRDWPEQGATVGLVCLRTSLILPGAAAQPGYVLATGKEARRSVVAVPLHTAEFVARELCRRAGDLR